MCSLQSEKNVNYLEETCDLSRINQNIDKLTRNISQHSNLSKVPGDTFVNNRQQNYVYGFENIAPIITSASPANPVIAVEDSDNIVILETPIKHDTNETVTIHTLNQDVQLPLNTEKIVYPQDSFADNPHPKIIIPFDDTLSDKPLRNGFGSQHDLRPSCLIEDPKSYHIRPSNRNDDIVELNIATPKHSKSSPETFTPQVKREVRVPTNDIDELHTPTSNSGNKLLIKDVYYNELSPEMFSADEEDQSKEINTTQTSTDNVLATECKQVSCKEDRVLLKRFQESLTGVLPPPSVTICQYNVHDFLQKIQENSNLFVCNRNSDGTTHRATSCDNSLSGTKSLLADSYTPDFTTILWPNITEMRFHGLHYNRSKVSEDIEQLSMRYVERCIGNETASSCTVWPTNAPSSVRKRRTLQRQLGIQSPGRRLSHLAKRRITFSKENVSAKNSVLASVSSSRSHQIMMDIRKRDTNKQKKYSPRKNLTLRKTPNSKSPRKKRKTPRSSAKKRTERRLLLTGENHPRVSSAASSKRALFQSPDSKNSRPSNSTVSSSKSKRALFLELDKEPENPARKRKRSETDQDFPQQRTKFPKSFSTSDEQPAKISGVPLQRRFSEYSNHVTGDFSDLHKKKMMWAISEALRSQAVNMNHPKFKTYAATLARIIKALMSDLTSGGPRKPGGTSERMLKIARQHVYAVFKGRTAPEILDEISTKISIPVKPKGYVAPPEAVSSSNHVETSAVLLNTQSHVKNSFKRKILFGNLETS